MIKYFGITILLVNNIYKIHLNNYPQNNYSYIITKITYIITIQFPIKCVNM